MVTKSGGVRGRPVLGSLFVIAIFGCAKAVPANDPGRTRAALVIERAAYPVEKSAACAQSYAAPRDAAVQTYIAAGRLKSAIHSFTHGEFESVDGDKAVIDESATLACRGVPTDQFPQDWN